MFQVDEKGLEKDSETEEKNLMQQFIDYIKVICELGVYLIFFEKAKKSGRFGRNRRGVQTHH
jgi:hypothetical protein